MREITPQQQMVYLYDKIKRYMYHLQIIDEEVLEHNEYEALMKELIDIENEYPDLKLENSPTDGLVEYYKSEKFDTIKLNGKIPNLKQINSKEELREFIDKTKQVHKDAAYYVECTDIHNKVLIEYVYGSLYRAYLVTDNTGEDLTENMSHVYDIPKYIPQLKKVEKLEVICNMYMENPVNEHGEDLETYIRRRIRTLDNNTTGQDTIRAYAHTILENSKIKLKNQRGTLNRLVGLGFTVQDKNIITNNYAQIEKFIDDNIGTGVKGITVVVDRLGTRKELDNTSLEWGVIYV